MSGIFGIGPGGGGKKLQLTVGFVSTGPAVVCVKDPALEYVHSYDTIEPGADEVLALNVQLSVEPALAISHVSVSVGPVMPNRATAVAGFAIVMVADLVAPAYVAEIVPEVAPEPGLIENENVALVVPALTMTIVGTRTGASPDRVTVAPVDGAADVSVTVPLLVAPSATVVSASDRFASAAAAGIGGAGVLGVGVVGVEERAH